jgi:hypothetical protein
MWDKCRRIIRENVSTGSIDLSKIESLELVERGEDRPLLDQQDESTLALNIDALDSDDRSEIIEEVRSTKRSQGRLFQNKIFRLSTRTVQTISDQDIQETVRYFESYISGPHLELLERALALNKEQLEGEVNREEMNGYKRDIAEDYERNVQTADYTMGYTAIHLASGGYFKENGYMRRIHEQVEDRFEEDPIDHESIFESILNDNPFLVMVGRDDSVRDIISEFVRRIDGFDKYRFDIEFIDGRAFGGSNRAKLEKSIIKIHRNADSIIYACEVQPGSTMYRIFPESVRSLALDE